MPIEKLENNWRNLAPQDDKINTLYYDNINFMVINKINELIDYNNIQNKHIVDTAKCLSEFATETQKAIRKLRECQ